MSLLFFFRRVGLQSTENALSVLVGTQTTCAVLDDQTAYVKYANMPNTCINEIIDAILLKSPYYIYKAMFTCLWMDIHVWGRLGFCGPRTVHGCVH